MPRTRRRFLRTFAAVTGAAACASVGLELTAQVSSAPSRLDAKEFGATGDGQTLDTQAIQSAIDAAARRQVAVVYIPAGRYVCGTLLLKSGVTLMLDPGATLLGSLDPADYRLVEPFTDGVGTARGYALIATVNTANTGITGGTIDGRGAALREAAGAAAAKQPSAGPFLVLCVRSKGVTLCGVQLRNSAAWTLHLFQCKGVTVRGVTIRSVGLPNNDGIDVDSSSDVTIKGCDIETGDDAICLKTTSLAPVKSIEVTDCLLSTRCAAFKIGTESLGDFSHIRVIGCHVRQANLGAVKLLSVDGGAIYDVLVERMTVDQADTPIFVRLGARGRTFRAGDTPRPPGSISGVVIRDMTVARARRIGVLISGVPEHPVDSVQLERIAITLVGEPVLRVPADPPEGAAAYPEVRMFGAELPASGLYARHIRRLDRSGLTLVPVAGDVRPVSIVEPAPAT